MENVGHVGGAYWVAMVGYFGCLVVNLENSFVFQVVGNFFEKIRSGVLT